MEGERKTAGNTVRESKGKRIGRGFLHFLMMGGFIVILVAIVGIVIAVSTCSGPK